MILKAVLSGVKDNMKYHSMNILQALHEEYCMMFHVMGFKLYVKYKNGIAIEGVDFF